MSQNESYPKEMKSFWQVKILRAPFVAIPVFLLCQFFSFLSPPAQALDVPIPKDVSKGDVLTSNQTVKDRLHKHVREHLALKKTLHQEVDDYIIFIDHDGRPILPDLEEARGRLRRELPDATGLSAQAAKSTNELTFTFNSPTYPWSTEELALLQTALNDFYPVAKAIYGNPAFNITVNVRKDPNISSTGLYYSGTNEIVIRGASSQDNLDELCHEMIHAFRDDIIISLNSYEEGMTRAAEVEVVNRLADYNHWDENHDYYDDVYYEGNNRQVIGSVNGNFFRFVGDCNPFLLRRYQLSGYAWAKAFLENSNFFIDFNGELYLRTVLDPSVRSTESKLLDIASSIQLSVEGKPFLIWYEQQGVLNTNPPSGYFLSNRNIDTLYFFFRDQAGWEYVQANSTVQWAIYDYQDRLLSSGSGVTSSCGGINFGMSLPYYYVGRIKVLATAETPQDTISDNSFWPSYDGIGSGVFGVVTNAIDGNITITSLDDLQLSVSQSLVNGFFSVPSLTTVRGRFLAVFTNTSGQSFTKQFTKDASDYFLLIDDATTWAVTATASGNGSGTVTSSVGGVNYTYPTASSGTTTGISPGTAVTLMATANTGSTVSWTNCAAQGGVVGGTTTAATCAFLSVTGTKSVSVFFASQIPITRTVDIDIKPKSISIRDTPHHEKMITVTILSTLDFDASVTVDINSLTFGRIGDESSLAFCNPKPKDPNHDDLTDLECRFYSQAANFQCGDIEGILKGNTADGKPLEGRATVQIKPCQ